MPSEPDLVAVLVEYPAALELGPAESLGTAGGFSGARFWKVHTPTGLLCLRCWPREHPSRQRLEFIHAVLRHVEGNGFHAVPLPIETVRQKTYVEHGGHLWELSRWIAGEADYFRNPNETRLVAALEALAAFHQAAATFPHADAVPAPAPGILARKSQLERLVAGHIGDIRAAVRPGCVDGLEPRARRLLDLFEQVARRVLDRLSRCASYRVPLQPCLRDVWHDHVHFAGNEVVGFVDFGAMQIDSVAGDVARLLGSLVGDDAHSWRVGLAAYKKTRPLSDEETQLVTAFDESGVLLSGVNWLDWVYCQGRRFERHDVILARVDTILDRLAHLAASERRVQ